MAQHHITLTCPSGHAEKAVGDPNTGRWYCFACHDLGNLAYTGRFSYYLRYDEPAVQEAELATAHDDPPAR